MEIKIRRLILSIWAFIIFAIASVIIMKPVYLTLSSADRREQFVEELYDQMLQNDFTQRNSGIFGDTDYKKLRKIKQSFLYLWNLYRTKAWMHDVIDDESGWEDYTHQAQSLVSAIGTLHLMGETRDLNEIERFFNKTVLLPQGSAKFSEYYGYVLEAFQSAYEMTNEPTYASMIQKYMSRLNYSVYDGCDMVAFDNNLLKPTENPIFNIHEFSSTMFCSLQMFRYTITKSYYLFALHIYDKIIQSRSHGLHQNLFNRSNNQEVFGMLSFDSNGYSFYDNLIKLNLLTKDSVISVQNHMKEIFEIIAQNFIEYRGDKAYLIRYNKTTRENIVTLDSFLYAGLIKLRRDIPPEDVYRYGQLSEKLMNGLFEFLSLNENGLPPKSAKLVGDKLVPYENEYDLSHRVLEVLFIFYRSTHDKKYRDAAWKIYKAVNASCVTDYGYCPVRVESDGKVTQLHKEVSPRVYSGFFKLLYLIFGDSSLYDFDNWIITSNGHLLKVWSDPSTFIDADVFAGASRLNVF